MAKKGHKVSNADEEEDADCIWCRPINAGLKAEFERQVPDPVNKQHLDSEDDPPPKNWVSCTRCKAWYHTDCVVLSELVSPVQLEPSKEGRRSVEQALFPEPGSSGSLPPELIHEFRMQGMNWDWAETIDKWSVTNQDERLFEVLLTKGLQVLHAVHRQSTPRQSA